MAKLTSRYVEKLPLQERGQRIVWDESVRGFGLLVGRTSKSYVAQGRVNGSTVRKTIGRHGAPDPETGQPWNVLRARKKAQVILGQMGRGIDPREGKRKKQRPDGPTLRDILDIKLTAMRRKSEAGRRGGSPRSIQKYENELTRHLADWLDRPFGELTGWGLHEVHDRLTAEGKLWLADRLVRNVHHLWELANKLHQGRFGWNPARAVERNNPPPKRDRVEDLADWHRKVQTLSPVRRDFQLFVLFTGLRSESARTVRWEHVDWKRKSLLVPKPKGGEERAFELPLSDTALKALRRRHKENAKEFGPYGGDDGWAFPSLTREKPHRVIHIAEAKERRKNENTGKREQYLPGPHVLRRTFISVAAEAGVAELDRHVLANHSFGRGNVNQIYISQSWQHLVECQRKIERALLARIKSGAKKRKRA